MPVAKLLAVNTSFFVLAVVTSIFSGSGHAQVVAPVLAVEKISSFTTSVPLVAEIVPHKEAILSFETTGTIDEYMVDIGLRVSQGDDLVSLYCADREANQSLAAAQLQQGIVESEQASRKLQRAQRLYQNSGSVTLQENEDAADRYAIQEAAVNVLKEQLRVAQVAVERCTLQAPWDGTVDARLFDEGVVVAVGQPVLTMVSDGDLLVVAEIPLALLSNLEVGSRTALLVEGERLEVELKRQSPVLKATKRTVTTEWQIVGGLSQKLRAGQSAQILIDRLASKVGGAWIPSSALLEATDGLWAVLIVDPNTHVARETTVQVIYRDNSRAFVSGSLEQGALVVALGADLSVLPGAKVKPVEYKPIHE